MPPGAASFSTATSSRRPTTARVSTTVPVHAAARADVLAAIGVWRRGALVSAGALLGISRRLGAGVASYPAPRYYALLAGPSDRLDDDLA